MSLIKNTLSGEAPANAQRGLAMLCAAALIALLPAWIYVADPLRVVIFFLCGTLAGAAAVLAWRRSTPEKDAANTASVGVGSDQALSWTDLATAMPDPAIVLDRSSMVLNYNAAARALFNSLRQGLALVHVIRDPELIGAVTEAFDRGEKRSVRLVSRRGPGQRFIATVTPLGGGDNRPVMATLITFHDQSEQHRLLEMRTDFIANASHELRTPLASVRGFIETLQGPARNDEAARDRFLAIMADQAERMTRLIDDLLLLSRVEEKANLKPTGRVDIGALIEDVVGSLSGAADERGMKITIGPATTRLDAVGDRDELFQVFHNLIENAVKYGRDGGAVAISLEKKADREGSVAGRAIVTVADDGPGIAPEHLPRLTERFYRVSAEHSRNVGGTGLGLAIVKHVLNRHGGELSVNSVVGHGTTVRVVLPALQ
jgi:two-component system phosphate regulon sensor histidine kinase PhoR